MSIRLAPRTFADYTRCVLSLKLSLKHSSRGLPGYTPSLYPSARHINTSSLSRTLKPTCCHQISLGGFVLGFTRGKCFLYLWIRANNYKILSADTLDAEGNPKPPNIQTHKYATAQKMRAAVSYCLTRNKNCSTARWHESEVNPGVMLGNPSLSEIVSSYMVALKRRKVQAREIVLSSRALTSKMICSLYDYNNTGNRSVVQPLAKRSATVAWCGARTRLLLHAVICLMFLGCMRSDEVLGLRMEDLTFYADEKGKKSIMQVHVNSRKNAQTGVGIKPQVYHQLPLHERHLDPFIAVCFWLEASSIKTGYLFRDVSLKTDRVSTKNTYMSNQKLLSILRENLLDINVDPIRFGTHCGKRGGVQWLLKEKRKPLSDVCDWVGWSADYRMNSAWRYVVGIFDELETMVKIWGFYDPNLPPQNACPQCGRSCNCA
ncbi:hypothetical protein B0H12DRAFT_1030497 [Mycena haematopus]|nr:hypothetical protein B0H12DRAFT_1030497 [Mycena haematopus]